MRSVSPALVHELRSTAPATLVPLAAALAMAVFHRYQRPPAAAEGFYLVAVALAVLLPAALVAGRRSVWLETGCVLSVLATWAIPSGPHRGATVTLLLVATLTASVAPRLARDPALPPHLLAALAVALQALLRPTLLLRPLDPSTLLRLLVLPIVAAAATSVLTRTRGPGPALATAGLVAILLPGFNRPATLLLVALAAVEVARTSRGHRRWLAVGAAGLVVAGGWRVGLAAAGVAVGLFGPLPALAAGLVALVAAALAPVRSLTEALVLLPWIAVLVPSLAAPGRRTTPAAVGALALALAGALALPGEQWLAPGLVLALLAVPPRRPYDRLQWTWTAIAIFGTALLAAYPWLRFTPLADVTTLLGLGSPLRAALLLCLLAVLVATTRPHPRVAAVAMAVLLGCAALGLPRTLERHLQPYAPVVLTGAAPRWEQAVSSGAEARSLVLETSLANSAGLPVGTPVATVRIGPAELLLRVGLDSGEWAAQRPDLVAAGVAAPSPWIGWVDRSGEFFGSRYRTVYPLPPLPPAAVLEIERRGDLPADLEVSLLGCELRR